MTEIWVVEIQENAAENRRRVIEGLEDALEGMYGVKARVKAVAVVGRNGVAFVKAEDW